MKFVGLVGSNYDQSYNRKLLEFIRRYFKLKFELEVLEIDEVPMFNQDENGMKVSNYVIYITKLLVQMVLSLLLLSTTTLSQLHSNLYLNGFHTKFIHLKTSLL
ncbi:putative oxidoreductase [Streptococcus pneumoniae]|nr:putative oxidoreductase [Streptococcus pneumoniae]